MKQFNLEEYLKNPSRKVITRSGLSVLIKGIYFSNPNYPVEATINNQLTSNFTAIGLSQLDRETEYDLFFESEKPDGGIHLYQGTRGIVETGAVPHSDEEAQKQTEKIRHYLTTIKIEWKE